MSPPPLAPYPSQHIRCEGENIKSKATILISALLLLANGYALTKNTVISAALQQLARPSVYVDSPTIRLSDEERIRKIEEEWHKALERKDAVWLGQHTAEAGFH